MIKATLPCERKYVKMPCPLDIVKLWTCMWTFTMPSLLQCQEPVATESCCCSAVCSSGVRMKIHDVNGYNPLWSKRRSTSDTIPPLNSEEKLSPWYRLHTSSGRLRVHRTVVRVVERIIPYCDCGTSRPSNVYLLHCSTRWHRTSTRDKRTSICWWHATVSRVQSALRRRHNPGSDAHSKLCRRLTRMDEYK